MDLVAESPKLERESGYNALNKDTLFSPQNYLESLAQLDAFSNLEGSEKTQFREFRVDENRVDSYNLKFSIDKLFFVKSPSEDYKGDIVNDFYRMTRHLSHVEGGALSSHSETVRAGRFKRKIPQEEERKNLVIYSHQSEDSISILNGNIDIFLHENKIITSNNEKPFSWSLTPSIFLAKFLNPIYYAFREKRGENGISTDELSISASMEYYDKKECVGKLLLEGSFNKNSRDREPNLTTRLVLP